MHIIITCKYEKDRIKNSRELELFFYKKTDVSPLFVVRNIKMSLNEISNGNNGELSANNPVHI